LEAAQRIRFKMTLVVDLCKVAEFVTLIGAVLGAKTGKGLSFIGEQGEDFPSRRQSER
jgi:hypothetical protein